LSRHLPTPTLPSSGCFAIRFQLSTSFSNLKSTLNARVTQLQFGLALAFAPTFNLECKTLKNSLSVQMEWSRWSLFLS
jgi:hypothetical protein